MRYGELDIHPLFEGRFTVGLDKRFVPYAEGDQKPKGALFIAVCPFLVRTQREVLLLDTGLGGWAEGRGTEVLLDHLAKHGVTPENVDRVLLSHLHFDHAGGAVSEVPGGWRPTFPNAEYVVQGDEQTAAGYAGESARARETVWTTLAAEGQLVTVDGNGFLTDEVEHVRTGGHTEAHQLFRLHTDGRTALFGGDVLPEAGQVSRRFIAKYDVDGEQSQAWRDRLSAQAASRGHLLLFVHGPAIQMGFVDEAPKGGYRVEPATDVEPPA